MKFLAVMLLMLLGRYKRRSKSLVSRAGASLPSNGRSWLLLMVVLVLGEVLMLELFNWKLAVLILAIELLALYFFVENWSPSDLTGQYYRDWCRGDFQTSWLKLAGLLGLQRTDEVTDSQAAHYAICQQYLYLSLTGFFALLFWFICLGLPGLFLALWAGWSLQRKANGRDWLSTLIIGIPAKLLGFTFFMVGNGVSAYNQLKHPQANTWGHREWLFRIALGALGEENIRHYPLVANGDEQFRHLAAEEIINLNKLIRRAAIFWLVLLGLLTMMGIDTPFY
ncbi:hypothetical protein EH243_13050 [Amphritea opalescens]|uniref:Uncharacterized protein n=1 Tax=Amphritea opalescens TaxID=2490544 RepID=A0A430KNZ1_9GAMM|nr:hypothetical protein [Amphritea opalescens]RTE65172.1 hypothetical protein EH243_13050 [Amphritea opalescens]